MSGVTTSYSYNERNLLTISKRQTPTDTVYAYTAYDGQNNRLSLTYNGQTVNYLQDIAGAGVLPVVLQEINGTAGSGTVGNSYMYLPGSSAPLFQSNATQTQVWYHNDGIGSVRALSDGSGAALGSNSFSAFGGGVAQTGVGNNAVGGSFGFAGEQLDPTGLYYLRGRYYKPEIGQFGGRDPLMGSLDLPMSLNRYAYSYNNPVARSPASRPVAASNSCGGVWKTSGN